MKIFDRIRAMMFNPRAQSDTKKVNTKQWSCMQCGNDVRPDKMYCNAPDCVFVREHIAFNKLAYDKRAKAKADKKKVYAEKWWRGETESPKLGCKARRKAKKQLSIQSHQHHVDMMKANCAAKKAIAS